MIDDDGIARCEICGKKANIEYTDAIIRIVYENDDYDNPVQRKIIDYMDGFVEHYCDECDEKRS